MEQSGELEPTYLIRKKDPNFEYYYFKPEWSQSETVLNPAPHFKIVKYLPNIATQ